MTRRVRRLSASISVLGLALVLSPSIARAQSDDDRSTARALGNQAQDAFDKKDFPTAADRFRRAVAIFDDAKAPFVPPTLLLGLARAQAASGKLVSAREAYNRVIRQGAGQGAPQVFLDAIADAKKEIDTVTPRIASVTLNVTGCDKPQVTIDGAPLPTAALGVGKPIDPGPHVVKATAAGCEPGETTFTVEDGKSTESTLTLKKDGASPPAVGAGANAAGGAGAAPPPPADKPSGGPWKTVEYAGFGLGAAGLILGSVTGIMAVSQHSSLANKCPGGVCVDNATSDLNGYHTVGTLSTVGFIVGGVGIGAGVLGLVLSPSAAAKTSWITPTIGLGTVGATGRF